MGTSRVRRAIGRSRFSLARYAAQQTDLAVPVIDGVPLFERLGDRYPGLAMSRVVPPSRQWLGSPPYGEDGRAVILDGTCGNAGCCGVLARIEVIEAAVVWHDFLARGRPPLPTGLRFEFDHGEYVAALHSVSNAPRVDWPDEN
jgi:hypothetical protein